MAGPVWIIEGIAGEGHYIADRRERYGSDLQSVQDRPPAGIFEGIAEEGHYIADRRERYGSDLHSIQDNTSAPVFFRRDR